MVEFKIIPILGRKTDVPADHYSLFKGEAEGVYLTHDVGGLNFDLVRKRGACSKSYGYVKWTPSATSMARLCLGLFELKVGSTTDHIIFDYGKCYVLDNTLAPVLTEDTAQTTFAQGPDDLYSIIQVGDYMVFADHGEHTPYKWKSGDANLSKLIASGTEYKFRYIVPFQRRVIGLYSDQANGDIEVRYSTDWPSTAITALNFPSGNQLYIPNDDSIKGGATLGSDRCFIYCEDSINELIYFPDYETPFRLYTVVTGQGAVNHHSIVSVNNIHYFFNKNYGFCMYAGGKEFPAGGRPISSDIEADVAGINADFYDVIVGAFVPYTDQIVWTVPASGEGAPNRLFFYNIRTGQWTFEDKAVKYVDAWTIYPYYTWNDFVEDLGGTGATWADAGSNTWTDYVSSRRRLVYANKDGYIYYHSGDTLAGLPLDGYRVEPICAFGDPKRRKLLKEIWFDIGFAGSYSIDVYHRMGDTAAEVEAQDWTLLGAISCDSPKVPALRNFAKSARLHQIKWGTDLGSEFFQVGGITFKFDWQTEN